MKALHPVPRIDLGDGYSLEALQGTRTTEGTKAAVSLLNGTTLFNAVLFLSKEDGWGPFVERACKDCPATPAGVASGLRELARVIEAVFRGPGASAAQTGEDGPYLVDNGCLCWRHSTPEGRDVITPLANFRATITTERVVDDGATIRRELELEGTLANGRRLPRVSIPAAQFAGMGWVVEKWGSRAIVAAGQGTKDRTREAVQRLSPDVQQVLAYAHSGWRKLDDTGWAYLHNGGAIAATGTVGTVTEGAECPPHGVLSQISAGASSPLPERDDDAEDESGTVGTEIQTEVSLSPPLRALELPQPPAGAALLAAVQASLRILDVAPALVMAPVLGAVYRAPLCEVAPADVAVWLTGGTGKFKTEIAVLGQQHYGATWSRLGLPASWHATANALERVTFEAKDALVVVDDFAPTGPAAEVAKLHATADRFIRSLGNRSGRGRMSADGALRPEYPPRGVVIGTGEDVPAGQSIRARCAVVEVGEGDVNIERLTAAQEAGRSGSYAAAVAGYVRWLAPRLDDLRMTFPGRVGDYRAQFAKDGMHRRTPDTAASLAAAWWYFLEFAVAVDALTADERDGLFTTVWDALAQLSQQQSAQQEDQEPAARFVRLVVSAITSGQAHLAGPEGGPPPEPSAWGWRHRLVGSGDSMREEWQPQGRLVGWLSQEDVYLDGAVAIAVAKSLGREGDAALWATPRTIKKRLHERGYLQSIDNRNGTVRFDVRKSLDGKRREVLHFSLEGFSPLTEVSQLSQLSQSEEKDNKPQGERPENTAPKAGTETENGSGPTVPTVPCSRPADVPYARKDAEHGGGYCTDRTHPVWKRPQRPGETAWEWACVIECPQEGAGHE